MLSEPALRRPDFQGGAWITLADQQLWCLPRPRVRFVPDDGPAGFEVYLTLPGSDDYGDLLTAAEAAPAGAEVVRTELALARALVLANYDLTPAQVATLVQISLDEQDDPEGCTLRRALREVAFGRGPKASAAGTD